MRVLITCPPLVQSFHLFKERFDSKGVEYFIPQFSQVVPDVELLKIVPEFDGWIIGDDHASREILSAGVQGRLRALIKWGIGVDSIDLNAVKELDLRFSNTPGMFNCEVADLAVGYVIALARKFHQIHDGVVGGEWPKIQGVSLHGKKAAVVGYGGIGKEVVRRLLCMGMCVFASDPNVSDPNIYSLEDCLTEADFIVLTCALTKENRHLINQETLRLARKGVRLVNVARGGLVNEEDLIASLSEGHVDSAALDVFDIEPLPVNSPLRRFGQCVFGSHNASNTFEGVQRTSEKAIDFLFEYLGVIR